MYFALSDKIVMLYLCEWLPTYRDNDDLSVLRAADRNINNSFVDSLSKQTGRLFYVSVVLIQNA